MKFWIKQSCPPASVRHPYDYSGRVATTWYRKRRNFFPESGYKIELLDKAQNLAFAPGATTSKHFATENYRRETVPWSQHRCHLLPKHLQVSEVFYRPQTGVPPLFRVAPTTHLKCSMTSHPKCAHRRIDIDGSIYH